MTATVLRYADLGTLLLHRADQSQIGLDVRIIRGSASIGQTVTLLGPNVSAILRITGIEMHVDRSDPSVARLHCSTAAAITIPEGDVKGTVIVEMT